MLYESVSPASKLPTIIGGSGTPWNSGFQSQPPPRAHLRSKPDPGVRTEGLLTCWYKTGRSRFHQTPGDVGTERKCVWTSQQPWPLMSFELHCFTWILLLPQSATMMFPLTSTATPVGALNWPFPSPLEPNFNSNSPSEVKTWPTKKKTFPVEYIQSKTFHFMHNQAGSIRGASPWQSGCGSQSQWSRCSCLPLQSADL